jgi:PAS domain-containing protein
MDLLPEPNVHLPIDYFFRSLALEQGARAICIVLSGSGSDGALGLRAIKGHSGMAIVQDVASAQYAGMPQSAAATTLADYVLPPDRMPAQLLAYTRVTLSTRYASDALDSELTKASPKIFVLLRDRSGHDFGGYKVQTMERRVERRMRVHQLSRAAEYLRLLQTEPRARLTVARVAHPRHTVLSRSHGVPGIGQGSVGSDRQPVRARAANLGAGVLHRRRCILHRHVALELAERAGKPLQLQIFASDLVPRAIQVARSGLYPTGIAAVSGLRAQLEAVWAHGTLIDAYELRFETPQSGPLAMRLSARRLEDIGANSGRVLLRLNAPHRRCGHHLRRHRSLKRAERLAAANAFAQSVVETVREPLVVLDSDLRVVSSNRAFAQLVRVSSNELHHQRLLELAGGPFALPQVRSLLEAVSRGAAYRGL